MGARAETETLGGADDLVLGEIAAPALVEQLGGEVRAVQRVCEREPGPLRVGEEPGGHQSSFLGGEHGDGLVVEGRAVLQGEALGVEDDARVAGSGSRCRP